ncbi:MAG: beta-lactamase family protein [Gammaproteobacteria bacterium]|nr:beta-lactamase family protein [Gammaproteobacteria bacterium]
MVLLMVESGFAESGHSIVKKWIVMLAISLSWGMVSIAWAVQPTKQILNQQLRQIVNHERLTYQLPALSVAIQLPMETTPRDYVSGYLTVKEKYSINANTIFQIGSITKTYTATIILKLAEMGKLSLTDNLAKWLPQYPKWQAVTINNLLTHTSGVYKVIDVPGYWQTLKRQPKKAWTLQQLADLAYHYPNYFKAGQGWNYSNSDYILLGLIIEKATQQSVEQVFNRYLLHNRALGLTHTHYISHGYPQNIIHNLAHGYDDEGTFGYNQDVTDVETFSGTPAGSIVSTPNDVVKFLQQLFNGKILSSQSLHTMQTLRSHQDGRLLNIKQFLDNQLPSSQPWFDIGQGTGLGLVYLSSTGLVWMHAGGMPGYQSLFAYDPCNGIYVVLMYNKQPKIDFIFLNIVQTIFKKLRSSPLVKKQLIGWKNTHKLPSYCHYSYL